MSDHPWMPNLTYSKIIELMAGQQEYVFHYKYDDGTGYLNLFRCLYQVVWLLWNSNRGTLRGRYDYKTKTVSGTLHEIAPMYCGVGHLLEHILLIERNPSQVYQVLLQTVREY